MTGQIVLLFRKHPHSQGPKLGGQPWPREHTHSAYPRWWSCWPGSTGSELDTGRTGAGMTGWASPVCLSDLSAWFPAGLTVTGTPRWSEPLWYQTHTSTHAPQRRKIMYTMSHHLFPWIRDNKGCVGRKQSRLTEVKKQKTDETIQKKHKELILL